MKLCHALNSYTVVQTVREERHHYLLTYEMSTLTKWLVSTTDRRIVGAIGAS